MKKLPLIVFSHLRWDFVYQRPQHLLSRFARDRQIFFIEEPVYTDGPCRWETRVDGGVHVCKPLTNLEDHHGFDPAQITLLVPMMRTLLRHWGLSHYAAWAYTPMCYPLITALNPDLVIFDVMDELSAFMGAPAPMLESETRLLGRSDIVFTGGASLYRSKRGRHTNVHCFPSSVDAAHFGAAQRSELMDMEQQQHLARPRLGYCGVIDERIDMEIISHMSVTHPEWQIVMVGPVVKIDPRTLPRASNIHYLGQQAYADLPRFMKGWDVCLMPFALNASTQFISPTKTLEYMAAGKPVVSTAIRDVVDGYAGIVPIGASPEAFVAHCENMLAMNAMQRAMQRAAMDAVLARTSWDGTVRDMDALIDIAIAAKQEAQMEQSPITAGRAFVRIDAPQRRSIFEVGKVIEQADVA